jgi:hypothetical protein
MSTQTNEPSRPDRIRDLLRKLQALMDDPAATEAERANARAKLRCIMDRHRLTDADLLSETLQTVTLGYDHKDDLVILLQVAGEVLEATDITYTFMSTLRERRILLKVTPSDAADLLEAWTHYRPIISVARQAAVKRQRALRKEATAIGKGFPLAIIQKYRIFPPTDPRPQPKPTIRAFRRMLDSYAAEDAIRDVEGDKWQRKAGCFDGSQPLQLS